jgi:hypothetical protein
LCVRGRELSIKEARCDAALRVLELPPFGERG